MYAGPGYVRLAWLCTLGLPGVFLDLRPVGADKPSAQITDQSSALWPHATATATGGVTGGAMHAWRRRRCICRRT